MILQECVFDLSIEIKDFTHVLIVAENAETFRHLSGSLWRGSEGSAGEIILSEGAKSLKMNQAVAMIYNPFVLDLNA